jgi:hypothetical protein
MIAESATRESRTLVPRRAKARSKITNGKEILPGIDQRSSAADWRLLVEKSEKPRILDRVVIEGCWKYIALICL